ncbi:MAG: hypothetical protein QG660_70, partial [Pseudomonadota bacterium]|nr:hypothetical protein [Pseudomonadota bacterium]
MRTLPLSTNHAPLVIPAKAGIQCVHHFWTPARA